MFWEIATLAALGVGNYFGPANLGMIIDPAVRMEQLLIDSELHGELRRPWITDQPSHLTPYRIHGGVGPKSSEI